MVTVGTTSVESVAICASKKDVLKRHKESVHNVGDKKFTCELCSYKASRKDNLRAHLKNVHTK